jgi:tRNA (adenine58-N1)-methyltransferase non-catalytic subunit
MRLVNLVLDHKAPAHCFEVVPPSELPSDQIQSDRHKSRLRKRKNLNDALFNTREELFAGEWDG